MTGAPRFLLMVAQFLYRYLFVISEEAQHMRKAAMAARRHGERTGGQRRAIPRRGGSAGRAVRALLRARGRNPPRHAGAQFSRATFGPWSSYTFTLAT